MKALSRPAIRLKPTSHGLSACSIQYISDTRIKNLPQGVLYVSDNLKFT